MSGSVRERRREAGTASLSLVLPRMIVHAVCLSVIDEGMQRAI